MVSRGSVSNPVHRASLSRGRGLDAWACIESGDTHPGDDAVVQCQTGGLASRECGEVVPSGPAALPQRLADGEIQVRTTCAERDLLLR